MRVESFALRLRIEDTKALLSVRAGTRHPLPVRAINGEVGVNRHVTEAGLALVQQRSAEGIRG
jgi:hypothetical protein